MQKLSPRQPQFMTIFYHLTSSVTFTFNLPEQMFQMALLQLKESNCAKLFWNPPIYVQVMAQPNLDGQVHAWCMHIHQNEVVTTMSRSPQEGSTEIISK